MTTHRFCCCYTWTELEGTCPWSWDGGWGEHAPPAVQATYDAAWGRLTDAGGDPYYGIDGSALCLGFDWNNSLAAGGGDDHFYINAYSWGAILDTSALTTITKAKMKIQISPIAGSNWTTSMKIGIWTKKGAAFPMTYIHAGLAVGSMFKEFTALSGATQTRKYDVPAGIFDLSGAGAQTNFLVVPSFNLKPTYPGADQIYKINWSCQLFLYIEGT